MLYGFKIQTYLKIYPRADSRFISVNLQSDLKANLHVDYTRFHHTENS